MLQEWKAIVKKPFFLIAMAAVMLIPSLYNLIFLNSMWDPYGNIDQLPVAVVNQDQPTHFQGKDMAIGKDMVTSLRKNQSLDFHFVSEKAAQKGLKEGTYYMVVTLPKDMSQTATTLLTDHPEQVNLSYQTSAGHSFIASKMSESAMTKLKEKVSQSITQSYVRELFRNVQTLDQGLKQAADGSLSLANGTDQLKNGSDALYTNLERLSQASGGFSTGLNRLEMGMQAYTDGTHQLAQGLEQAYPGITAYTQGVSNLHDGLQTMSPGLVSYSNGVGQLASGANLLDQQSDQLMAGVHQLAAGSTEMQPLVDGSQRLAQGIQDMAAKGGLSQENQEQLAQLSSSLSSLNEQIQSLQTGNQTNIAGIQSLLDRLSQEMDQLSVATGATSSALSALEATATYQSLPADQQAELTQALAASSPSSMPDLSKLKATLQEIRASLANVSPEMPGLEAVKGTANQLLPAASSQIRTMTNQFMQLQSGVAQNLLPASQAVADGMARLQAQVSQGTGALGKGIQDYTDGVHQLAAGGLTLSSQSGQLTNAMDQLVTGADQLEMGSNELVSATARLRDGASQLDQHSPQLLSGVHQLTDGANRLQDGADQLTAGSKTLAQGTQTVSDGTHTLADSLAAAHQKLGTVKMQPQNADALSHPVQLQHTDQDRAPVNGYGMAPYMASAALFVAAIATNTLFGVLPSGGKAKTRWQVLRGRLQVNGLMAVLSAVCLYGTLHWMGLNPRHEGKTLLILVVGSVCFAALTTMLNAIHHKIGAFLSLILLMVQLATSQGTYPGQLSYPIYSVLKPFFPMSYTVSGLRETISMTGKIQEHLLVLVGMTIVFVGLGYWASDPTRSLEDIESWEMPFRK